MTLPDFVDGSLPPGRHRATVDEVRAALVEPFVDSSTRAAIHTFWQDRRAAVADLARVRGEWLDGSFTSDKRDPADLDLVTILHGPDVDDLPRHRRQVLASLVGGTTTEEFWSCDAGVVVAYPDDPMYTARTAVAAGAWAGYFGRTREGAATGIVEVLAEGVEPVEVALDDDAAAEPEAQLQAHLQRFERALQAFGDPRSTDRPGLRLMAATLRDKRDDLEGKLEAGRRVEVELSSLAGPMPAQVMGALVTALCDTVGEVGEALVAAGSGTEAVDRLALARALELTVVGSSDAGALVLRGAEPTRRRAVPGPAGAESLLTAVLHRLLDALDDGSGDEAPVEGHAGAALHAVVTDRAAPLAVTLRWPFAQDRIVEVRPAPIDT